MNPAFSPFSGYDPFDGDDPRMTLSRDNPCRQLLDDLGRRLPDADGFVARVPFNHASGDSL